MTTYEEYLEGTRQILELSKTEKVPYRTKVAGREFIVCPNVFSPKYFRDSELFAQNLPIRVGEDMLEIGPGTGAIAITAIYRGARRVVAIDINPGAVRNTQANIDLHSLSEKAEVRQGDAYDALKPGEKFDVIFCNTPFGYVEEDDLPLLERSVFDPHYRFTKRLIKEAPLHLREGGRLLIGFSTTLGRLDLLEKFCDEADLQLRMVYEAPSYESYRVMFQIFEAKPM